MPPAGLPAQAVPLGARLRVPIGRRETIGWVVGRAGSSALELGALKRAHELIDPTPVLDTALMRLLRWTANYYHHPLGELIASAVPKAVRAGRALEPTVHCWRLTAAGEAALSEGGGARAPRQRALLALLAAAQCELSVAELDAQMPGWRAAARALTLRGWAEPSVRTPPASTCGANFSVPPAGPDAPRETLSAEQAGAVERIDASAGVYTAFVLRGVTGSGKTEVYLHCAERALARGRTVLLLVPEIALTTQLIERVRQRLPVRLSVLHSGLADGDRLEAWREARAGTARVVLGTRSAVFAPLLDLGLVIVDEEHDGSYKQQEGAVVTRRVTSP